MKILMKTGVNIFVLIWISAICRSFISHLKVEAYSYSRLRNIRRGTLITLKKKNKKKKSPQCLGWCQKDVVIEISISFWLPSLLSTNYLAVNSRYFRILNSMFLFCCDSWDLRKQYSFCHIFKNHNEINKAV